MIVDALVLSGAQARRDPDVDSALVTATPGDPDGRPDDFPRLLSLPADSPPGRAVGPGGRVRGVYVDPEPSRTPLPEAQGPLEVAGSWRMPLVVAAGLPGLSGPEQLAAAARAHPDVTFVASNGGQLDVSGADVDAIRTVLRRHPNVYVLSGGVYREDLLIDLALAAGGPRVLFGSFAPRFDQRLELFRIRAAPLPADVAALVLGGLACRLFGLMPEGG